MPTPSTRPNLLFVMADDLNVALGCYGHPAANTPNIDRLAGSGVRFARAYCTYPLCGPSRTALLTGKRPENLGMWHNEFSWRDKFPDLKMLPQIARENGYYTERIGKIQHHGIWKDCGIDYRAEGFPRAHTHKDPPSWVNEWGDAPRIYEKNARGPEEIISGEPHGGTSLHTIRATNPESLPDTLAADRACAFLDSPKSKEVPFVLGVGFQKPHMPLIAPEKWWAYYDGLDVESLVPPTWWHPAELPPGTLMREGQFHRDATEEQRRHLYKGYLASISHIDEQLGRILSSLDRNGLADNTYVVFVADHGYHIGEQAQWDKMMLLEPSLHIPLLIAGPGVKRGATCNAVVESLDLFPTLLARLGLPREQETDGRDLSAFLKNPDIPSDHPAFAFVKTDKREGWTIRTDRYRYTLARFGDAPPRPILFDLQTDPHESTNLAGKPELAAIRDQLHEQLCQHFHLESEGKTARGNTEPTVAPSA